MLPINLFGQNPEVRISNFDYEVVNEDIVTLSFNIATNDFIAIPISEFIVKKYNQGRPVFRSTHQFLINSIGFCGCDIILDSLYELNYGEYNTDVLPRVITISRDTILYLLEIHQHGLGEYIDTVKSCLKAIIAITYTDFADYREFDNYFYSKVEDDIITTNLTDNIINIRLDSFDEFKYAKTNLIDYKLNEAEVAILKTAFNQYIDTEFILKE